MSLKRLLCRHTWELVHKERISVYDPDVSEGNPIEFKYVVIQRCPKCGKFKKTIFRY